MHSKPSATLFASRAIVNGASVGGEPPRAAIRDEKSVPELCSSRRARSLLAVTSEHLRLP